MIVRDATYCAKSRGSINILQVKEREYDEYGCEDECDQAEWGGSGL